MKLHTIVLVSASKLGAKTGAYANNLVERAKANTCGEEGDHAAPTHPVPARLRKTKGNRVSDQQEADHEAEDFIESADILCHS